MNNIPTDDINGLLEKWHRAKMNISDLEKDCEKYKRMAEKIMDRNNTDVLHGRELLLKKTHQKRAVMLKQNVPPEVWSRYCGVSEFDVYSFSRRPKKTTR